MLSCTQLKWWPENKCRLFASAARWAHAIRCLFSCFQNTWHVYQNVIIFNRLHTNTQQILFAISFRNMKIEMRQTSTSQEQFQSIILIELNDMKCWTTFAKRHRFWRRQRRIEKWDNCLAMSKEWWEIHPHFGVKWTWLYLFCRVIVLLRLLYEVTVEWIYITNEYTHIHTCN